MSSTSIEDKIETVAISDAPLKNNQKATDDLERDFVNSTRALPNLACVAEAKRKGKEHEEDTGEGFLHGAHVYRCRGSADLGSVEP